MFEEGRWRIVDRPDIEKARPGRTGQGAVRETANGGRLSVLIAVRKEIMRLARNDYVWITSEKCRLYIHDLASRLGVPVKGSGWSKESRSFPNTM
jgi:hypothetical protein